MKNILKDTKIDLIKDKIMNTLLSVYSLISIPFLLISISRTRTTGWLINYTTQIVLVSIIWMVFLLRKKYNYKLKAIFTAIVLLILCFTGIHYVGLLSSGFVFFMLFAVFATLFLGRKYGYITLFMIAVIIATYATLFLSGVLTYQLEIDSFINEKDLWILKGLSLVIATYSVVLIIGMLEDAYKNILSESHKNELDYKLLFELSTEGIVISDLTGKILLVNQVFKKISGYYDNDIIGKNFIELIMPEYHSDDPLRVRQMSKGETITNDSIVTDKFGNFRYLEIISNVLPDGRLQSLIKDVTERKKIQKEIEDEKAFGKTMIEAMHGVFYVFENYEKLVHWNESLLKISGYSQSELEKIHPNNLFGSGNYDNVQESIVESENKGSAYFKADLLTKSGKRIPLYNSAISYEREGKIYLMGMGYDITNLIQAEQALKNSEENFKNIYNSTSDATFIFNYKFEILSANETFFSLTGLDQSDLSDINIFDFIFEEKAMQKVAGEINKLGNERVVTAEYLIRNKEGHRFPVEVRSRQITYEGQPAVVTAFNDISARKDFEKKIYTVSMKAEEDERGRIAKDLHDGLGPLLSTCKIYLHNIKNSDFNSKEIKSFNKLSELINESLTGVKEISNNLSPHILRNFGLVHALDSFIDKFSAFTEIKIEGHFNAPNKYDEIIEITLYRVVTELLNNTLKHSEAKNVSITLVESSGKLNLTYYEDGKGFDFEQMIQKKSGLGLFNIKSRINSIGGIIIFKSLEGEGISIKIETNI